MNNIYAKLKSVVGSERVSVLPEDRIAASYDASKLQNLPDVIAKPKTTQEVAAILRIANETNTPVYPRGAATSVTGAAVPAKGGIVIDLSLMNRIVEINTTNLTTVVEPGVVVADLQKEVESKGLYSGSLSGSELLPGIVGCNRQASTAALFYPPDPASAEFCTIGGNIATNAGGLRCIKYGTTKDYVLGLEAVLANGEIINTGRGTLKHSVGYDLTRLLLGSEGTLGIVTQIILRLIPKPEAQATFFVFYKDEAPAIQLSIDLLAKAILPRALEFMDAASLRAVRNYKKDFDMPDTVGSGILIELDGNPADLKNQRTRVEEIIRQTNPLMLMQADTRAQIEKVWSIRKAISPALYSITDKKISEDICLPRDKITAILDVLKSIENKYRIPMATFGHLGDGNLHVNFLVSTPAHQAELDKAVDELFRSVIGMGGALSGEHGIGLTKSKYITLEVGPVELALMKQVKAAFDPKGILNPGKIFPS